MPDPRAAPAPWRRPSPADLKAWRARLGLTRMDAARRAGVSRRSLDAWEAGHAAAPKWLGYVLAAVEQEVEPLGQPGP